MKKDEKKSNKLGFIKMVKYSFSGPDKYIKLSQQSMRHVFRYLMLLTAIISILITMMPIICYSNYYSAIAFEQKIVSICTNFIIQFLCRFLIFSLEILLIAVSAIIVSKIFDLPFMFKEILKMSICSFTSSIAVFMLYILFVMIFKINIYYFQMFTIFIALIYILVILLIIQKRKLKKQVNN